MPVPPPPKTRRQVVRDVLVFQLKLFADGIRDVLFSPISLILGAISLLNAKAPGELFYQLLRAGRSSEHWIDLFGAAYAEDEPPTTSDASGAPPRDLEQLLRDVETRVRGQKMDQSARDGIARVRAALKKYL